MNERTELLGKECKPVLNIVVYCSDKERGQPDYYLESHQISPEGKIMEGKPLLQSTIAEMVELFYDDRKDRSQISGAIPENLLSYLPLPGGNFKLVWYRPAETRYIHFAQSLRLQSGKASIPPMIYEVSKNTLSVFALKIDAWPTEKTKLFRSPFHNVGDNGTVCLGNAKVKKPLEKTFANVIKYWEDLFWLSEFSHLNGASNPTKSDLGKLWARIVKSKCRLKWSALSAELKETKKSIKILLK